VLSAAAEAGDAEGLTGHELGVGRRLVLLAVRDDDRREELAQQLREESLIVVELEDGLELADYLELALGTPSVLDVPSLIVCDVALEGRSGIEILHELRGSGAAIPVLLIQDRADAALAERTERLGGAALVEDPTDLGEWAEAMELLS
jgi:CheY-like chemotaxis protein